MKNNHKPIGSVVATMVALLVTAVLALPASAGDTQDIADLDLESLLDNVVLSASKHRETLEESPANVFIITRAMIDNYGFETIGEALSIVPGIYVTDDYSLAQVGVRGVATTGDWNSHIMVLLDGRSLSEQYGGTSSIDVPGIDLANLDRIEVVKGPASSLYGSNAFFGMINLISKVPDANGAIVSGSFGSGIDTKTTSLSLFHRFNEDMTLHVTGSFHNQGGNELYFGEFSDLSDGTVLSLDADGYHQYYLDSADFSGGYARDHNLRRNYSTHSHLDYKDFSLTLHLSQLNTGIAHSMWGSLFERPENQYRERRHYVDLGYQRQVSNKVELTTRLSYTYYTWADYVLYNYSSWEVDPEYLPGPLWKDFEYDSYVGSEVRLNVDFNERHKLIFGGETQFHRIRHESGEADLTGEVIYENVIPAENVANDGQIYNLYAQDEYRFSPKVKLVTGLHFNYYSYTTGRVMPKGALIVNPYSKATYKFIVSRGFRSPSFYELTFDDGETWLANPDLKPETITSYEVIVSHQLPYGMAIDLAVNDSRIHQLVELTWVNRTDPGHPGGNYLDDIYQQRNGGEMRSTSAEISLRTNPIYRLSGFANATWQKVEHCEEFHATVHMTNSPRWLGNIGLVYQLVEDRVSVSARARYIASRLTWDETQLEDNVLIDLMLRGRNLIGGLGGVIGVKNLLDQDHRVPLGIDYEPSSSIQRPGRSIYVSARMTTGW